MVGYFSILEIIICVFVAFSLVRGITRGLSGQILRIVGIVGGAFAAKSLYEKAGGFLSGIKFLSEKLSIFSDELATKIFNIAGFALVWAVVLVLAFLLTFLIKPKKNGKRNLDKLLGVVFSLVICYAIVSVVLGLADSALGLADIKLLYDQVYGGAYLKFFAEHNFIGGWIIKMFAKLLA